MIRAFHASNYRSLGDDFSVVFPSAPPQLVTLAGPNAAGKSNALDALRFVADALRDGVGPAVRRRGSFASLRRGVDARREVMIAIEAVVDDVWWVWGLRLLPESTDDEVRGWEWGVALPAAEVAPHGTAAALVELPDLCSVRRLHLLGTHESIRSRFINGFFSASGGELASVEQSLIRTLYLPRYAETHPSLARLLAMLSGLSVYSIEPATLRQRQLRSGASLMLDHGENWSSVLQRLLPEYRGELVSALSALVPDVADVRVDALADDLVVQFEHRSATGESLWIPANRESDGTLRVAALLTALLQEPPPSLLAIEEPELAVHVRALETLREYVLTRARSTPVILSTHSPHLLDMLPLDSLRVVSRSDEGTAVAPLSQRQRTLVRQGVYTLAELAFSQPLEGEGHA
ncbi:MAG: ATP-binding protein [Myxococcales bacterium]|nr:ATP-binding protein [Myxococcales bacterium]